jgi:tRNA(Arg) A34 adenosine deaminase TadA
MAHNVLSRRAMLFGTIGVIASTAGAAANDRADLTAAPAVPMTAAEAERHTILLRLAMALTFDGWGVDRHRPETVAAYRAADPGRTFADYLGHNIGALLVDRSGNIVCFALNRAVQFNSTLEHAEARAVRAAIAAANATRPRDAAPPWTFGDLLRADKLYTTLEPCAQCAGIMQLANLGEVIYAQDDPSQCHVVNVLYNLGSQPRAPVPVRADFLPAREELEACYRRFLASVPSGGRSGLTSFLETVPAYQIYRRAAMSFESMSVRYPSNVDTHRQAKAFRDAHRNALKDGLIPL